MTDVYSCQPVLSHGSVTLRPMQPEDLDGLLRCYSDPASVPLFNSDNCNGDDFHYTTPERMKQAMDFWTFSYRNQYFVRWTIVVDNEVAGTVEMFSRLAQDGNEGVMRIDLASAYEQVGELDDILEIARLHFYNLFGTDVILTKAVPIAEARLEALRRAGYSEMGKSFLGYEHYYTRAIAKE